MNESIIPATEPEQPVSRQLVDEFELVLQDYLAPFDFAQIFGREAPLEVDLGCGDGSFLAALAERSPERNFLGVERLLGRARAGGRKLARRNLRNARILRLESAYTTQFLLPPESVDVFYLMFPDPWPKRKHRRRRVMTPEFVAAAERALKPGGRLRIATDQEPYFVTMREVLAESHLREVQSPAEEDFPVTRFEKQFLQEGAPIYRLELRKVS